MKKRIFIIHGWGATPDSDWYPWVAQELEAKGHEVIVPPMPETETPTINAWVDRITKVVGRPDENTFFIGHSIGCQAILRYLSQLIDTHVGGVVCVAGFFTLQNLEEGERPIATPWLTTPLDFAKARNAAPSIIAFFSDNDQYVPLAENKKIYEQELGADALVLHSKGHFTSDDMVTEMPEILELF